MRWTAPASTTAMMKKSISSPFTFFFKFILPSLPVAAGVFALIAGIIIAPIKDIFVGILFVLVWIGIPTVINCYNNLPLKKVYLDDGFLYVSNYVKQIRIPLSEIDDVKATGNPWAGSWRIPLYRIVIRLKHQTEFGEKILLIPDFYYKEVVCEIMSAKNSQADKSERRDARA
jgi:hypothetical protein